MQRAVSIFDLLHWESTKQIVHSGNELAFKALMFNLGFDITQEIVEEECYHRPLHTNKTMFGIRWVGRERTDEKWLSSKECTYDNKLERIGLVDVELQKDLLKMSTVPSIMEKMIAQMSEYHDAGTKDLD